MSLVFISAPYRSKSFLKLCLNIYRARKAAKFYWKLGYDVICPHSNSAFFPEKLANYVASYLRILEKCDILVQLPCDGTSEGMEKELSHALWHGLEIRDYKTNNVLVKRRDKHV